MFPLRKFYTEQTFVLVRMQLRNHVDTQTVKRFKCYKGNAIHTAYDRKFGMFQVRENDISLRKWIGAGTAHLRGNTGRAKGWRQV